MHQSIKQKLTFTAMMVVGMSTVMSTYNIIWGVGFSLDIFKILATSLIPTMLIAFALEALLVGHIVHKIHARIVSPDDHKAKHIIVLALLFVTFMASLMSLYGTLTFVGLGDNFWQHYLINLARNWPVALFTQLVIMGPLVRLLHTRIFQAPRPETVPID